MVSYQFLQLKYKQRKLSNDIVQMHILSILVIKKQNRLNFELS